MARAKQIQTLIDDVNYYLRANHITDQYDATASVVMHSLIQQNLYKGFKWFKNEPYTCMTGRILNITVGCPEEEAEFIQILQGICKPLGKRRKMI